MSEGGSEHKRRASLTPRRDGPRLAAGRARALGLPTRGTTNANRLRRVDRWLLATQVPRLRDAVRPLVVDLGYGSSAVTTLELVDRHCLAAVDAWKNMGLSVDAEVVLLGRTDAPGAAGEAEAARMLACFEGAGASWAAASTDEQESEALFAARRLAYPALERLGPVLTEDVCVPKAAVPEMLARIEATAARTDVLIANIAHAGDGNLHPLLITPPGDTAARERAQVAFTQIMRDAVALGGTVTGEHGIGLLKREGLAHEQAPEVVAMQRAVKAALDPHGILNPGKVLPE